MSKAWQLRHGKGAPPPTLPVLGWRAGLRWLVSPVACGTVFEKIGQAAVQKLIWAHGDNCNSKSFHRTSTAMQMDFFRGLKRIGAPGAPCLECPGLTHILYTLRYKDIATWTTHKRIQGMGNNMDSLGDRIGIYGSNAISHGRWCPSSHLLKTARMPRSWS